MQKENMAGRLCLIVPWMLLQAVALAASNGPAVVAEVEPVEIRSVAVTDDRPTSEASIRVVSVLRGDVTVGEELLVRLPGGETTDGGRVKVLGVPQLRVGERALVGLEPAEAGTWRIVQAVSGVPVAPASDPTAKMFGAVGELRSLGDKCLDVLRSDPSDGTPVIYFRCTGNPNQAWRFRSISTTVFEIRGLDDRCLVPGPIGSITQLPEMVIGPCGTPEAFWRFNGAFPGSLQLVHNQTGQCLDVYQSSTDDFTPIVLFQCTGTPNQRWSFESDDPAGVCFSDSDTLCLNDGRFAVEIDWRDFAGFSGPGRTVLQSGDSGIFWFFAPDNWEVLIKVLDACSLNGRYWVFFAATTDVQFTLEVTDTLRGETLRYFNPLGNPANAINDTDAFATCP